MTVVNPKSISGITSITTASGSDDLLTIHTNNGTERLRVDSTGTTKIVTGIVTTLTATTGIVTTFEATTGDITTLRTPTGIATHFTANKISLPDSSDGSLCIGIGSDFKINHNGTDSFITEVGGGDLYIQGSDIILRDAGTLEKHIEMTQNGAVDIYHNGTKKFETTSTGATLSGNLSIDANIIHNGDTDTMLSFSTDNQVDIKCADTVIGKFTTNGLAIGDNKRLDIFDASGDRSGMINNSDSGANALRISADPDNSGSSSSLQFHVDGTERARVDSTGDLTISDGDLVIGTAGHGIDFSATSNSLGSMGSEILDDYEEGTFTPVVADAATGGNTASSYTTSIGWYTKIGNIVNIQMRIRDINQGSISNSSTIYIRGFPYAMEQRSNALVVGHCETSDFNTPSNCHGVSTLTNNGASNPTWCRLFAQIDNATHGVQQFDSIGTTNQIQINMTYRAA